MSDADNYERLLAVRRLAVQRFNACLGMLAGTWNTLVLAVLIASIVTPIVETKDAAAALTPSNGAIAIWCIILHLNSYLILRFSKAE